MAVNKKYIIGIDVGGSKIIAALIKNVKIIRSIKISTLKNRKEFLEKLEILVRKVISDISDKTALSVGCGVAGVLDLEKGVILNAPNLRFLNNFNIKNWLTEKFNCEVKVDNDARCFTRGEYLYGAGRGYKNIIGITFGTGIGGGIIINGKMFYGANYSAGELGHMILNLKSPARGEARQGRQNSNLKNYDWEFLTLRQTKNLEENLGIGFANIINILDPEIIVVGGGASGVLRLLPKARKVTNKFIISPKSKKNVKILMGKLGENAGALGAAALFYESSKP